MEREAINRLCDLPHKPDNSLAYQLWDQCSKAAPAAAALAFGTADGFIINGADRYRNQPSTMLSDGIGSVGIGLALKAAPRYISVPAAIAGGAGTMLFLHDAAKGIGDCLPIIKDAACSPNLARKEISTRLGPIAFESMLMVTTGVLTSAATERIQLQRSTKIAGLINHKASSRLESTGGEAVVEYWLGAKPASDLSRMHSSSALLKEQLALYRDLKIRRTAFGAGPLKVKTLSSLMDDNAKHEFIRKFDPEVAERASSSIRTVIPMLTRPFTGVACVARPLNHPDAKLYRKAQESVVKIEADKPNGWSASGTGFIVSEDGKVATALHVVADAHALSVRTHDGNRFKARLIAHDVDTDLAVLKLDKVKHALKPMQLATEGKETSRDLFLFGHPAGSRTLFMSPGLFNRRAAERNTVTKVCGSIYEYYTGRSVDTTSYYMHCRPGYSGGPVLNSRGNVVAVHTAGDLYKKGDFREVRVGSGPSSFELQKFLNSLPQDADNREHIVWKRSMPFEKTSPP